MTLLIQAAIAWVVIAVAILLVDCWLLDNYDDYGVGDVLAVLFLWPVLVLAWIAIAIADAITFKG